MLRISRMDDNRAMLTIRGKMGLIIKVGSISQDRISKPVRVLSRGCFVASARDDIWVIVTMHQIVSTVISLAIWHEIVRTAITVGSLVILLKIVLIKERQSRSKTTPECML